MPDSIIDIDEQLAQQAIAAKRHKELTGALKGIAAQLGKPEKEDSAVADAIKESVKASKEVAQAIKDMPQPEVNVQVSQNEIVASLEGICKRIEDSNRSVVAALENKLLVESFKITTGQYGLDKTINVVYKPSNQLKK